MNFLKSGGVYLAKLAVFLIAAIAAANGAFALMNRPGLSSNVRWGGVIAVAVALAILASLLFRRKPPGRKGEI